MDGEEDCFAARLATAFRTRFAGAALDMATLRLCRAEADRNIVKIDLFTAVTVILRDTHGIFARSRRRGAGPRGMRIRIPTGSLAPQTAAAIAAVPASLAPIGQADRRHG